MDERMRTNNNIHILKDIEIGYWCEENRYFTKKAVHESTKVQLALMKRRGFLKDYNPQSNYEIVTDIEDSILRYRSGNLEILLEIFDLIQCWGGRMGKALMSKKIVQLGKFLGIIQTIGLCIMKLQYRREFQLMKLWIICVRFLW